MADDQLPRWIKEMIMEEVSKQLQARIEPIKAMLESLNRWKLSLWSNGSGGPPGYLEMARDEDDKRYEDLQSQQRSMVADVKTTTEYIILLKEREDRKEKRSEAVRQFWSRIGWKIGAGVGTLLLGAGIWLYHEITPIAKILWEDYLNAHPIAMRKIDKLSTNFDPAAPYPQPSAPIAPKP
jgi:hypothetical protein